MKIKLATLNPFTDPGLHMFQKSRIHFVYGGLKGKVSRISADTLEDERGQTYFLVEIKTDKITLGTADNPLKIIPGMTVSVDILTGKKSVLN